MIMYFILKNQGYDIIKEKLHLWKQWCKIFKCFEIHQFSALKNPTSIDDICLQMAWFIIVRTVHLGNLSRIVQYKKRGWVLWVAE